MHYKKNPKKKLKTRQRGSSRKIKRTRYRKRRQILSKKGKYSRLKRRKTNKRKSMHKLDGGGKKNKDCSTWVDIEDRGLGRVLLDPNVRGTLVYMFRSDTPITPENHLQYALNLGYRGNLRRHENIGVAIVPVRRFADIIEHPRDINFYILPGRIGHGDLFTNRNPVKVNIENKEIQIMRTLLAQFNELTHGGDIQNWYVVMVYVCSNPAYGYRNDSMEFPGGWDDSVRGNGGSIDNDVNIRHSRDMAIIEYTQETTMPIRDCLHIEQLIQRDRTLFSNTSQGLRTCGIRDRFSVKTEYRVFVCINPENILLEAAGLPRLIEGNINCRELREHTRPRTGYGGPRDRLPPRERREYTRPRTGYRGPRDRLPPRERREYTRPRTGYRGPRDRLPPRDRWESRKRPPTGKGSWRK